jgi:transposase
MMTTSALCLSKNGLKIQACMATERGWTIEVTAEPHPVCPDCGSVSTSRHSWYRRMLQDLPIQGAHTMLVLRICRWRCRLPGCRRLVFAERLPEIASKYARRSHDLSLLVRLFGHQVGGRPSVRLLDRLGISLAGTTVLRQAMRDTPAASSEHAPRVLGLDDWAWSKGQRYGTILVDLETRRVVDLLPDRSASGTAAWLKAHPGAEIICRDRHGLYAQGARGGAPQARQVADRFHLLQNLRELLETEFSQQRGPTRRDRMPTTVPEQQPSPPVPSSNRSALEEQFSIVRQLHHRRVSVADIVRQTGLSRRRVDKWVRLETLPERNRMQLGPCSPGFYYRHLSQRWAENVTGIRQLLSEIQKLGFTGSRSRLADYLSAWRSDVGNACPKTVNVISEMLPIDPVTGRRISSLTASVLCMKPFAEAHDLVLRFQTMLRYGHLHHLSQWIAAAAKSEVYALQRFAKALKRDRDVIRNAIVEPWSSGQVEGQINRLKTIKRSMYGRGGIGLLRARLLPLSQFKKHHI